MGKRKIRRKTGLAIAIACGILGLLIFFFISTDSFFNSMALTGLDTSSPTPAKADESPVFMSLGYLAMFFSGGIGFTLVQGRNKNKRQSYNDLLSELE
jgi:hypothetical protein